MSRGRSPEASHQTWLEEVETRGKIYSASHTQLVAFQPAKNGQISQWRSSDRELIKILGLGRFLDQANKNYFSAESQTIILLFFVNNKRNY